LVVPIVSIAAVLAVSLFLFDEYYLPQANKRQDALRNVIKGKPAQTVSHPEQNWIFGDPRPGEPGRIFYYRFFDPDRNEFANISVFEFDPATFALTRRIFAAKAVWDPETFRATTPRASVSSYRPRSLKFTKIPATLTKRACRPRK
jgi:lipopolysaccharide export LptBFGC system permease protein LptF